MCDTRAGNALFYNINGAEILDFRKIQCCFHWENMYFQHGNPTVRETFVFIWFRVPYDAPVARGIIVAGGGS